jgi:hypothetical protein
MKRFTIVLTLCCFLFFLGALAFDKSTAPTVILPVNPPAVECGPSDDCCPEVAGRYHLRGRTKRFFGRVA